MYTTKTLLFPRTWTADLKFTVVPAVVVSSWWMVHVTINTQIR